MKESRFSKLRTMANEAIQGSDLTTLLQVVEDACADTNLWSETERVREIRTNYQRMLEYLRDGVPDPHRDELRRTFMCQLILAFERASWHYDMAERRPFDMLDASLSANQRFDAIYDSPLWGVEDMERMLAYVTDDSVMLEERALCVSAVMLATQRYFDPQKLMLLCLLCRDGSEVLRVRSLVGLVLVVSMQCERVKYFSELQSEIHALVTDADMQPRFRSVQMALIAAQSTPHANLHLMDHLHDLTVKFRASSDADGFPGIDTSFSAMLGVQEMGADLNLMSFIFLSKQQPFFQERANWFWPFTTQHPALNGEPLPKLVEEIFRLGFHTETDRYGFALTTRNKQIKFRSEEGEDLSPDIFDSLPIDREKQPDMLRPHVFDLFRYYTIFCFGSPLDQNPFTHDILLLNYALFASLYTDEKDVLELASGLMRGENYGQARPLLERLSLKHPESAKLLRMLAQCSMEMHDYPAAVDYYFALLGATPDDAELQLSYANALVHSGREEEALPIFYKLQYNADNSAPVQRGMAWCLLLEGSVSESLKIYGTLTVSPDVISNDHVNMGHALLLQGDIPSAIACYDQAIQMDEVSDSLFDYIFSEDAEWLYSQGIDSNLMGIIIDALR